MTAPAPAFHSFSVPTSPATTRSSKGLPVTPQRLPRHHHRHSQSAYRSPNTPSTPYTPLSLRSSDSAGSSSTLTTPDNVSFLVRKRLGVGRSPDACNVSMDSAESKDRSLADLAQNWRARANQHGIKVSSSSNGGLQDVSHFGDDEASDRTSSDIGNDSSIVSTDDALLPPPFMSYHRRSLSQSAAVPRRPRALSHSSLGENKASTASPLAVRNANCTMPFSSSPVRTRRTLASVNNLMSTPPPNRAISAELKLKGSLTDPAQPRRREVFGVVPMLPNNIPRGSASTSLKHDTSLDLFNINEHDFEYENDVHNTEDFYDESFSLDLQNHTANIFGYSSVDRGENKPAMNNFNAFADPFFDAPSGYGNHILNTISESVEHHFHTTQPQFNPAYPTPNYYASSDPFGHYLAKPTYVPLPQSGMLPPMQPISHGRPHLTPIATFQPSPIMSVRNDIEPAIPPAADSPTECSVCLASYPSSLAVLQPCSHPLCSACLTSALNIVGEKDMECAVCNRKVADFKLVSVKKPAFTSESKPENPSASSRSPTAVANAFGDVSDFSNGQGQDLDKAFELGFDFSDLRASTPKLGPQATRGGDYCAESAAHHRATHSNAVLRIDNVPWDITPRQISTWLQQPVERVHVLLDNKGKTLSHAYVEVKEHSTAGAILRGETAQANSAGRKERGSVLGKGKRARGVTITRSSQDELMANLFPTWRGTFEGSKPSLARLEGDAIIRTLEGGLLTDGEINSLRHLIQAPDSHFLKVPVLPFHSLVSLLCKFPPDIDSRVFWSAGLRDKLFDLACVGLQELVPRVERARRTTNPDDEHTTDLVHELAKVTVNCRVFTADQVRRYAELLSQRAIPVPEMEPSLGSPSEQGSTPNILQTPNDREGLAMPDTRQGASFAELAKEFGVEAQLVQALAHRLAAIT